MGTLHSRSRLIMRLARRYRYRYRDLVNIAAHLPGGLRLTGGSMMQIPCDVVTLPLRRRVRAPAREAARKIKGRGRRTRSKRWSIDRLIPYARFRCSQGPARPTIIALSLSSLLPVIENAVTWLERCRMGCAKVGNGASAVGVATAPPLQAVPRINHVEPTRPTDLAWRGDTSLVGTGVENLEPIGCRSST